MSLRRGASAALFVCLVPFVTMVALTGDARESSAAIACSSCGVNLIQNPGAEAAPGTTDDTVVPVPDWTTTGGFTVAAYAWSDGDLTAQSAGTPNPGDNYFYGGGQGTPNTATQTVTLPASSGGEWIWLEGWLGGYADQDDSAEVSVTFTGNSGQQLTPPSSPAPTQGGARFSASGPLHIGPVTEAERGGVSKLMFVGEGVPLPAGAQKAEITITMSRTAGSDNDGLADNLALVLTSGQSVYPSGWPASAPGGNGLALTIAVTAQPIGFHETALSAGTVLHLTTREAAHLPFLEEFKRTFHNHSPGPEIKLTFAAKPAPQPLLTAAAEGKAIRTLDVKIAGGSRTIDDAFQNCLVRTAGQTKSGGTVRSETFAFYCQEATTSTTG